MPDPAYPRRPLLALLGLAVCFVWVDEAFAQRPFRAYDHFYRNETARRAFYDGYAVTGEVAYRPAGSVVTTNTQETVPALTGDLGVSLRLDYQLSSFFDVGVIVDALGNGVGRSLSVRWVSLKYYRAIENANYAFRLAVDPATSGGFGFPQTDLAFIYTTLISPLTSTDFAIGVRRVRLGYQQAVPVTNDDGSRRNELLYSQAHGWEAHLMFQANLLFDPAGSYIFAAFLAEGGNYDLLDLEGGDGSTPSNEALSSVGGLESVTAYQGGVVRLRLGLQVSRPVFQFTPFIGIRLRHWSPAEGEWQEPSRLSLGARLMLR